MSTGLKCINFVGYPSRQTSRKFACFERKWHKKVMFLLWRDHFNWKAPIMEHKKLNFFSVYDYHFLNSEIRFSFSLKVYSYWLFTLTRKIASFLFFVSLIYFNMKNIFILIELVLLMYLRKTIKKVYIYLYSYWIWKSLLIKMIIRRSVK